MRYLVRDRMLAFHEEAWVETEHGQKLFKVNRKLLRLRTTFDVVDLDGNQVASIVKKALTFHHTILIKQNGDVAGRISKRTFRIFGDRFKASLRDGRRLRIAGNLWDREFDIADGDTTLAHISRRWFSIRDAYAVDVMHEPDALLLIILAVCVDHIIEDRNGEQLTSF